MSLFKHYIKSGYWMQTTKAPKGWLNLEDVASTAVEPVEQVLLYPVENTYIDNAEMFANQGEQTLNYFQYVAGTDIYYQYLGTTNGDISDYIELTADQTTIINGKIKAPVDNSYPDLATMYQANNQRKQIEGFIYRNEADDTYYEYLGTRNGDASDYKQIGGSGGGLLTASQGLTVVGNDVQLGGTITSTRNINTSAQIYINSTFGGTGVSLESSAGIPFQSVNAAGGNGASFVTRNSQTNTILTALSVGRQTTGTPGAGIGVSLNLNAEVSTGNLATPTIGFKALWTDPTTVTRTSRLEVEGYDGGTRQDLFAFKGNGQMELTQYGSNTFTGTAAQYLAVDASGNVIEAALPSNVTFGTDNQIPIMNSAGTDFEYSNFKFIAGSTSILEIGAEDLNSSSIRLYAGLGGGTSSILFYSGEGVDDTIDYWAIINTNGRLEFRDNSNNVIMKIDDATSQFTLDGHTIAGINSGDSKIAVTKEWVNANIGYDKTGYTVATLPGTPSAGDRTFVTDSTVAASGNFGATVVGGGANTVPVFYDGSNWIIA